MEQPDLENPNKINTRTVPLGAVTGVSLIKTRMNSRMTAVLLQEVFSWA